MNVLCRTFLSMPLYYLKKKYIAQSIFTPSARIRFMKKITKITKKNYNKKSHIFESKIKEKLVYV